MDRKHLESELAKYIETFKQAREQALRLEGVVLYIQQTLQELDKDKVLQDKTDQSESTT